ncbi:unnamed protein product [Medioppia subpectinata]|uniref:eIF-4F 25 kDa subunit n=1 Tax=Medioppia subpectinata TaxID=1979941 RepID=A0A7R9PW36_9ACAR|nr:unnamed protein product [Medioppia subpectinata]CAG2103302.1 unnamed protein product [Medioppia subpectinata]
MDSMPLNATLSSTPPTDQLAIDSALNALNIDDNNTDHNNNNDNTADDCHREECGRESAVDECDDRHKKEDSDDEDVSCDGVSCGETEATMASTITAAAMDGPIEGPMDGPADGPVNHRLVRQPAVNSRHPLTYRWQLWFWRADPGVKVVWRQALQRVCEPLNTIEDFWSLYHHIVCVQQLVAPSDYCLFKAGVEPMWEDCHNINGGKWSLEFPKGPNRQMDARLDDIWLEVLLCLIGEGFNEFGEEICGAVVNVRAKEDRISVWTANSSKSVANLRIGEILKVRTGYSRAMKYEAHETSQRIALQKERLYDSKPAANQRVPQTRRSCVF